MARCDECGCQLQQQEDDSFNCPCCDAHYSPIDEEDEDE